MTSKKDQNSAKVKAPTVRVISAPPKLEQPPVTLELTVSQEDLRILYDLITSSYSFESDFDSEFEDAVSQYLDDDDNF